MHKFTVRALTNCEMFLLTIEDLEKMKMEFPEYYIALFNGAFSRLQKELLIKFESIKREEAKLVDSKNRLRAIFLQDSNLSAFR